MLSDEMKQVTEDIRSRKLLRKNNSCMDTTTHQPIFREKEKVFAVEG